jgi:hypothetical protein
MESVAQRFEETPFNVRGVTATAKRLMGKIDMAPTGILILSDYDALLDLIPEDERVVAVWPFHPVFRRDQTAIALDERPSYFFALAPDDAYRRTFEPMYFRDSLEKAPPALISTSRMELNYPPGWKEATVDFLANHGDLYVLRRTRLFEFWIRRDLVKT